MANRKGAAQERKVPMLRSENSLIEQEFESVREKFESDMHRMEDEMAKFRSQLLVSEKSQHTSMGTHMPSSSLSSSLQAMGSEMDQPLPGQQQEQHHQQSLNNSSSSSTSSKQTRSSCSSSQQSRSSRTSVKSSIKSAFEEKEGLMERHKQQLEAVSSMNSSATSQRLHYARVSPSPAAGSAGSNYWWLNELSSPLIKDSPDGTRMLKLRFDVTQYEPERIIVKTVDNRLLVHAKREQTTENSSVYSEYNREFLLPEGIDPELIRSSLSADGVLTVEAPLPTEVAAQSIGQQEHQQQQHLL